MKFGLLHLSSVLWVGIWSTATVATAVRIPVLDQHRNLGAGDRSDRLLILNPISPGPCQVGQDSGTVLTPNACRLRGGVSLGAVNVPGGGAAVCCEFTASCNAQTSVNLIRQNVTYLESAGDHDNLNCVYTIPRVLPVPQPVKPGLFKQPPAPEPVPTCQLRVELLYFDYEPPATGAPCAEYLQITGSTTVADGFTICGQSSAILYLSYGDRDSITLTFSTEGTMTRRAHRARVTRIACEQKDLLVPESCLQQLEGNTSRITSFAYPRGIAVGPVVGGQSYAVCVRAPSSATGITWKECDLDLNLKSQFFMSTYFANNLPASETAPDPLLAWLNNMPVTGDACEATSYVQVLGEEKHCGARFSGNYVTNSVTSNAKPFILLVHTKVDDPLLGFPIINPISFPFTTSTGPGFYDVCLNALAQPPYAVGFRPVEVVPPTPACSSSLMGMPSDLSCDTATSTCAGHCICYSNARISVPAPIDNLPRTGFCLEYTLI